MHTRLAGSLLLVASAVILSFASVLAGEVILPVFRNTIQPHSLAELRSFIPDITLFACDHLPLIVVLLSATCMGGLAALWRLPNKTVQCIVAGLCAQWLVVWAAAFCFCYEGFLGSVSMHHPQWFEFDEFMSLAGGVFPLSFILIVMPLIIALWPKRIR